MNVNTGALYESMEDALNAGESAADLVEITGTREQVEKISKAVQSERKHSRYLDAIEGAE